MDQAKAIELEALIERNLNRVIDLRHQLHCCPELGFNEFQTEKLLREFLSELPGLVIEDGIAGTGLVAVLGAGKPGPCVGFRADMDALPILETTGLPYASRVKGMMHACGHDGHCAILAGLILTLAQMEAHLPGPVKFIFQPAEEGLGGGKKMVEAGVLRNPDVDAIFGLHGWPDLNLGEVATRSGPFFAGTHAFDLKVTGKGGHAAFPHQTVDPVVAASHIVTGVQSIVSRNIDPLDSLVISFTKVEGGSAYNVIPDTVCLGGTVRWFNRRDADHALQRLVSMSQAIASSHGAKAELEVCGEGYPPVHCDKHLSELFLNMAERELGAENVKVCRPVMGGEDFAYYAEQVPGCLWLLGLKERDQPSTPRLHTSQFDFNDSAISLGIRLQASAALEFFNSKS